MTLIGTQPNAHFKCFVEFKLGDESISLRITGAFSSFRLVVCLQLLFRFLLKPLIRSEHFVVQLSNYFFKSNSN